MPHVGRYNLRNGNDRKIIDFNNKITGVRFDGSEFNGNPDLYQPVFYHDPNFNDEDKKQYQHLLQLTSSPKKQWNFLSFSAQ